MTKIILILALWFGSLPVIGCIAPSTILINSNTINSNTMNLEERFLEKVYPCPITGCWHWGGTLRVRGSYGSMRVNGENELAHRVAYSLYVGELPSGLKEHIAHKCDTPLCVNPDHLEKIPAGQNQKDAYKRGLKKSALLGKFGKDNPTSKAVLKIDKTTGKILAEYESLTEAGRNEPYHFTMISYVANGKHNTRTNFTYIYKP